MKWEGSRSKSGGGGGVEEPGAVSEEPLRPCEFENLSNEINRGKKLLGYFESLLLGPASQPASPCEWLRHGF